jgi:tetratricopeptide (TPR) repeat protein
VLVHLVAAGIRSVEVPLFSRLVTEFLTTLVPVLMARVLGLLLFTRGDSLEYGLAQDYLEPVLGKLQPRSELPPLVNGLPTAASEEAPAPVTELLLALTQALEARDAEGALALYPQLREPRFARQLAPEQHLFVGQAAVARGQYELAVKALETAADVAPDSPEASRALVLLARVYAERLREPERAQSIYRYVVHRYPNTDASRFALAHLPPTS